MCCTLGRCSGYHYSLGSLYTQDFTSGPWSVKNRMDLEGAVIGTTAYIFVGGVPESPAANTEGLYKYDLSTNELTGPVTWTGTMPNYLDANIGRSVTVIGTDVRCARAAWPRTSQCVGLRAPGGAFVPEPLSRLQPLY